MNGQPLSAEHGAPLRAVVGGWYGMASVKWLTRIIAVEKPFDGFWQTIDYSCFVRENGLPVITPAHRNANQVVDRTAGRRRDGVPRNSTRAHLRSGVGRRESAVSRVDVSTDGGKSWAEAKLIDKEAPMAWRLWEYHWKTPSSPARSRSWPARPTRRGRTQPMDRDIDRRTYVMNHVLPVEVQYRLAATRSLRRGAAPDPRHGVSSMGHRRTIAGLRILITGASQGIGRALALLAAQQAPRSWPRLATINCSRELAAEGKNATGRARNARRRRHLARPIGRR